jgi:glycerol kinase
LETTALGAAYAAGLTVGFWKSEADIAAHWRCAKRWRPSMGEAARANLLEGWEKAVERSLGWEA